MTCRRAYELDLASFLADPRGAAWADFRDHYPRCAACAAEVRAWTELELALGSAAHPEPEELARWVDESPDLTPARRRAVAEHVAACVACRDETRTLRRFDPLAEAATAPAAAPVRRPGRPWLRRIFWNPALAYALALVLGLYPLLADRLAERERERAQGVLRSAGKVEAPAERAAGRADADRLAKRQKAAAEPSAEQPALPTANAAPAAGAGAGEERRALKDAEALARPVAPVARADAPRAPVFGLRAGEETPVAVPAGATEIELRVAPVPPGTTRVRLTDEAGQRSMSAPFDGALRVPGVWLGQGRYVVELLDGERTLATAHLTVTR